MVGFRCGKISVNSIKASPIVLEECSPLSGRAGRMMK